MIYIIHFTEIIYNNHENVSINKNVPPFKMPCDKIIILSQLQYNRNKSDFIVWASKEV